MNNREHIDELISKFLSGEASPEEAMLLEDWKMESPDNREYYRECEKTFALLAPHTGQLEAPNEQKAWEQIRASMEGAVVKPLYLQKRSYFLKIAASFLLLAGLGALLLFLFRSGEEKQVLYAAGKQTREIKLADGTEVTILANSSITAEKGFGIKNRLLHLKGNAYFSVKHQEGLPLVIDAGQLFIKDIGTRFGVRFSTDSDTVFVNVDEGVVLLFNNSGSTLEIRATEKAYYIRSKKRLVKQETSVEKISSLHFSNETLENVVSAINTAYATTIVLENAALKNCTLTNKFNGEDLETILGIITETLGLTYEKTVTGYVIKGHICHS